MRLVTVMASGLCTPRVAMQSWRASITTATPFGSRALDRVGDLDRELLLDLQAPREDVDHARELAEADHASVGKVRDVRASGERDHVVLAVREQLDVAHDDHLVVAFDLLERARQDCSGVEAVASEELLVRAHHSRRRVQ